MYRVTTGMLDRHRDTRLTGQRSSLPDYTQQSKTGGSARLNALNTAAGRSGLNRMEQVNDRKLENTADRLAGLAGKLAESADRGGVTSAGVESVLAAYNDTVEALGSASGVLNSFYCQTLKQAVSDNKSALAGIGITVGSKGSLILDKDKLGRADAEQVKQLLGAGGDFVGRISVVASRVADNAGAGARSLMSSYNSRGNLSDFYLSRYQSRR